MGSQPYSLVRDMVACLCSDSPKSAYESLSAQARTMSQRRSKELLRVLRHSNESIPGAEMGSLLEMEDIFADELDRAVHEREAELEAEGVDLQNEQPDEDSLNHEESEENRQSVHLLKYNETRNILESIKLGEIDEKLKKVYEESVDSNAKIVTAQLNAVFAGRKPAFFEFFPMMVRPFAKNLPPGIKYAESEHAACIYHEQAAARVLGIPPGKKLHEAICASIESGECGLLLGYGAPSAMTRPGHFVTISSNGQYYCGFTTSADKAKAKHYAKERKKDFTDQFPDDEWKIDIKYIP